VQFSKALISLLKSCLKVKSVSCVQCSKALISLLNESPKVKFLRFVQCAKVSILLLKAKANDCMTCDFYLRWEILRVLNDMY